MLIQLQFDEPGAPGRGAAPRRARRPRRGAAVTWFVILAMVALLPVLFVFLDTQRQATAKTDFQTASDAAALAAARTLVYDFLLSNNPPFQNQLARSAADAARLAACNNVFGKTVLLDTAGPPDADIVFGRLETPGDDNFQVVDPLNPQPSNPLLLNAVRITARKVSIPGGAAIELTYRGQQVAATTTVLMDRDVFAFQSNNGQPIPFVPLALLSGSDPDSWESQVEPSTYDSARDTFKFNPNYQTPPGSAPFSPGQDGLQEMTVTLNRKGNGNGKGDSNVVPLNVSITSWSDLVNQINPIANGGIGGVSSYQAASQPGGRISFNNNNQWTANVLTAAPSANDIENLQTALSNLAASGEARVWPLYSGDPDSTALVVRFVAARVVQVTSNGKDTTFLLQPAQLSGPFVVTDANRHVPQSVGNRYICKIHIIR
jgi:hypothetical protein